MSEKLDQMAKKSCLDEINRMKKDKEMQANLVQLGNLVRDINIGNGWNCISPCEWHSNIYKVPCLLALIHSELSEALEAYRIGDFKEFQTECADVMIRLLDLTHGLDIDLGQVVLEKLEKNVGRGYRHGGKRT